MQIEYQSTNLLAVSGTDEREGCGEGCTQTPALPGLRQPGEARVGEGSRGHSLLWKTDAATFAFLNVTKVIHCFGKQLPGACSKSLFLAHWC